LSEFEYLRSVTIGQSLPGGSPFRRLDARTRLTLVVIMVMALTFARGLVGLLCGLAVVVLGLVLAKVPAKIALHALLPPLPFLLLLAILQMVINPNPDGPLLFMVRGWGLSLNDLSAGAVLLLRFFGLVLTISLATMTMSSTEVTRAMGKMLAAFQRIGVPVEDFVMMVTVTLRFVPLLAITAERIAKAQAARGAEWGLPKGSFLRRARQALPMIVPLFLQSLRRAENMALAMDARAYGATAVRTSLFVSHYTWRDTLALVVVIAGAVATLAL